MAIRDYGELDDIHLDVDVYKRQPRNCPPLHFPMRKKAAL